MRNSRGSDSGFAMDTPLRPKLKSEKRVMEIKAFYDNRTFTLTYIVWDPKTKDAVVLDPVLDFDPAANRIWTESVDQVIRFLNDNKLKLHYVLETHAHADHLSGSQRIKDACPNVKVAIGARITEVQKAFKTIFDLPADFPTDGRQFDKLFADAETVQAGTLTVKSFNTPGHTPACATYRIGDALFTGDALFMPDQGTGRCDFPGGSAKDLYNSITRRIYEYPDATRVFVGHDYQPGGRALAYESTVGEQKKSNVALPASRSEAEFVAFREERDASLGAPKLLFQSVQVNVDAGRLPAPEANEIRYLRIPLNVFRPDKTPDPEMLELCDPRAAKGPEA
ncbi:MAG: MBL fold metallo-hydrolase [Polyangiaceae bacterium]|jgi:glyoxylase-like metal-dependent hydrolase (beta-lactamase superfamily II)|nr:MBL fold metallo-hydrolase [Polyangiaceae bacterium]